MKKPIFIPDEGRIKKSQMFHFMNYVEKLTGEKFKGYDELYKWSIENIEEFWKSMWVLSGLIFSRQYDSILEGNSMLNSKWFNNAELNFAENLLKYRKNNTAIISTNEKNERKELTYHQLYDQTSSLVKFFEEKGLTEGDRVACYLNNVPEAIIGMLATTSVGALWSSASLDFGYQGVFDRFEQIQPKVLITSLNYQYNGKVIDCTEKVEKLIKNLKSLEVIIIVGYGSLKKSYSFTELLNNPQENINFKHLPFDHPVYIMYSSGTTGKPKCIVHSAGGTLLQHYKELVIHTDLFPHDIITYYTTTGWMMWNWLVSTLQTGATIFLYDGSPVYENENKLWKIIEDEKITIFGTSPKYLSICEKAGLEPGRSHDLSKLKTILSTGSPLTENNFEWVYSKVKEDVLLSSISGGTDIISCFMLGNPMLPVYSGEIQCRGLGMAVESFDQEGKPVIEEKGELVCTKPFPSIPVYFWNDQDGSRYKSSYFEKYPGIWHHGDYIRITNNGGIIVYGRSDATLNPGGVRIGTAEIYKALEDLNEIQDSIAAGKKNYNDEEIILFVVLKEGYVLDEELTYKIKNKIKITESPRHVPAKIIQIKEVPYTMNGKKVELAVTQIINKIEPQNKDSLTNPSSLEQFYQFTD